MAKATAKKKSKATESGSKPKATKGLSRSVLAASATEVSLPADVGITFKSGLGQATASLFRRGLLINMQSISNSGNIHFSDVQCGDSISVNGVCSGTADITVSMATNPSTPEHFTAGVILTGYTIL